jgi:hypothetical protein
LARAICEAMDVENSANGDHSNPVSMDIFILFYCTNFYVSRFFLLCFENVLFSCAESIQAKFF